MKPIPIFSIWMKQRGYSDGVIKEIWKWYDYSERKGAANFLFNILMRAHDSVLLTVAHKPLFLEGNEGRVRNQSDGKGVQNSF